MDVVQKCPPKLEFNPLLQLFLSKTVAKLSARDQSVLGFLNIRHWDGGNGVHRKFGALKRLFQQNLSCTGHRSGKILTVEYRAEGSSASSGALFKA